MKNVLVLGFYFRKNLGDDAYIEALEHIIKGDDETVDVRFASMDDIDRIPHDVDTIVCGGGEIVNRYFMSKLQRLLKGFRGKVYGLSIGIGYESEAAYLKMFDHVFVRSVTDGRVAASVIGEKNVTIVPDAVFFLPMNPAIPVNGDRLDVAVCLAQPYFHANDRSAKMIEGVVTALTEFAKGHPGARYHFIPFNRTNSAAENDMRVHDKVIRPLARAIGAHRVIDRRDLAQGTRSDGRDAVRAVLSFIAQDIDIVVGMRYHSVVFALKTNKRFVAIGTRGHKIDKLLQNVPDSDATFLSLDVDASYKPYDIDANRLSIALERAASRSGASVVTGEPTALIQPIRSVVLRDSIPRTLKIDYQRIDVFEERARSISEAFITTLGLTEVSPETLLHRTGPLVSALDYDTSMKLARFACYVLTNNTDHPCLWGLRKRLSSKDLKLWDSLIFVWKYHNASLQSVSSETYFVDLPSDAVPRKVWWTTDRTTFAQEYAGLHRSGWAYAIAGLMHRDANMRGRVTDDDDAILIDTYMDRTFHWSRDVFEKLGILPYKRPWAGFVHHTFDETFSDYNCLNMIKSQSFIDSLPFCKAIFTLTEDLASKLRPLVPVTVVAVTHPTESLPESQCFSMAKFYANPSRKVVQIGAWLRDPYAIFSLPLPKDGGPLRLQKSYLKWKNMSQSLAPTGFDAKLDCWLDVAAQTYVDDNEQAECSMCRNNMCRNDTLCRNVLDCVEAVCCRNKVNVSEKASRNHIANKYVDGLRWMLADQWASVQALEGLDNDAYDKLLAENVVFLRLIEPSAVNTVIECIVRNTPIVVNRHPALEEALGKDYPGFYECSFEATKILCDPACIERMHAHLASLDKTRYRLDTFVTRLQDILHSLDDDAVDEEQKDVVPNNNEDMLPPPPSMLNRPLVRIQRYIPPIFRR